MEPQYLCDTRVEDSFLRNKHSSFKTETCIIIRTCQLLHTQQINGIAFSISTLQRAISYTSTWPLTFTKRWTFFFSPAERDSLPEGFFNFRGWANPRLHLKALLQQNSLEHFQGTLRQKTHCFSKTSVSYQVV